MEWNIIKQSWMVLNDWVIETGFIPYLICLDCNLGRSDVKQNTAPGVLGTSKDKQNDMWFRENYVGIPLVFRRGKLEFWNEVCWVRSGSMRKKLSEGEDGKWLRSYWLKFSHTD